MLPISIQLLTLETPGAVIPNPPGPVVAVITYAGDAPGLVSGLAQVNFQMPFPGYPALSFTGLPPLGPPFEAVLTMTIGAAAVSAYIWFE